MNTLHYFDYDCFELPLLKAFKIPPKTAVNKPLIKPKPIDGYNPETN